MLACGLRTRQKGVSTPLPIMTIKEAAIKVLRDAGQSLTIDEIYDRICQEKLFEFKASQPKAVLSRQLRSHCEGIEMKLASPDKYFRVTPDRKFTVMD